MRYSARPVLNISSRSKHTAASMSHFAKTTGSVYGSGRASISNRTTYFMSARAGGVVDNGTTLHSPSRPSTNVQSNLGERHLFARKNYQTKNPLNADEPARTYDFSEVVLCLPPQNHIEIPPSNFFLVFRKSAIRGGG